MAILEEIGSFLKSGSNLSDLADYLGTDSDEVKRPVGAAVSLLVAAVAKRSGTETGASALFDTVKGAGGAALEHVGAPFGQEAQVDVGEQLVDALLGGRREQIEDGLAEKSGMAVDQIQDLLPAMAPPVVAAMGRRVSRERMGRSSLLAELESDHSTMEREGLQSLLSLLDGGDEDADAFHFAEVMNRFNAAGGMNHLLPAAQPLQRPMQDEDSVYTSVNTTPDIPASGGAAIAGSAFGDEPAPAVGGTVSGAALGGGALAAGAAAGGVGTAVAANPLSGPSGGDDEFYGKPTDNRWLWILGGLLGLLLLLLIVWQCGGDEEPDTTGTDPAPTTSADGAGTDGDDGSALPAPPEGLVEGQLLQIAQEKGSFNELLGAIAAADLTADLESQGPFTLFAPTDEAFAAVPDSIKNDPAALREVLQYHVVSGVLSEPMLAEQPLNTLAGVPLNVSVSDTGTRINGANVTLADQQALNGVFHVVDQVLIPPTMWARVGDNLNAILNLENITFESGSATATAEGQAILDQAADFMLANPLPAIEIAGHTDSSGDAASNLTLSQQRADGVLTYLVDKGVDAALLSAVGYGDVNPVADNETPEGQAANRRIEFNFA